MFGVGEIVGLLALIIATLGFLSRSYAESISEIAGSHLEALQTAGASYGQVLVHGLIPEFLPSWINWTLFSFEINIRHPPYWAWWELGVSAFSFRQT